MIICYDIIPETILYSNDHIVGDVVYDFSTTLFLLDTTIEGDIIFPKDKQGKIIIGQDSRIGGNFINCVGIWRHFTVNDDGCVKFIN